MVRHVFRTAAEVHPAQLAGGLFRVHGKPAFPAGYDSERPVQQGAVSAEGYADFILTEPKSFEDDDIIY